MIYYLIVRRKADAKFWLSDLPWSSLISHACLIGLVIGTVLGFASPVKATTSSAVTYKPDYVYYEGICNDATVKTKLDYVLALVKRYNDNSARGLTQPEVEKIWDRNGVCAGNSAAALTRNSKTALMTTDYFGSYVTAKIKYSYGRLKEARYFADIYAAVGGIIRSKAKMMSWDNWLEVDAPYKKDMSLLNIVLK